MQLLAKFKEILCMGFRTTLNFRKFKVALIYGPSAKRAGHKSERKKRGSVTYSTDRENDVSKIFIISLGSKEMWKISIKRNGH